MAVVSSASFEPIVAPESLGTLFGDALSEETAVAQLNADGEIPTELGGVTLDVNGRAVGLLFVSPEQINFYLDGDVQPGPAVFTVHFDGESASVPGVVANVAPSIFAIPCLRTDRGAVVNGVSFELEPFSTVTDGNPGDDKRTRLSLFASGIRFASDGVVAEAVDRTGRVTELEVEYAGPAPVFWGLDQVNVVLPRSLEGAGIVRIRLRVGEIVSNFVSILVASAMESGQAPETSLFVYDVAGNGLDSNAGDGLAAVEASLRRPAAVVFDRLGALYIADVSAHVVRRVAPDGTISTVAGTGAPGDAGDGGPATAATLTSPVALAFSPAGDLYIADADARRIRRVSRDGIVHAFAGNGADADTGDGGPALQASFRRPSGLAVNLHGSVFIADAEAHRVRKVLGDGSILTVAGVGQAGFSGDGANASSALLNQPGAISIGAGGSLFIADAGNRRIRRVAANGTIWTVAGDGESGDAPNGAAAERAPLSEHLAIAAASDGSLCIADGENHRLRLLDANCKLWTVAGTGLPGFAPQGLGALETPMSTPLGVAVDPRGVLHYADSDNHRVRKLDRVANADGAACEQTVSVAFQPGVVMAGETAVAFVTLACPFAETVEIALSADDSRLLLPATVTAQPGQTLISVVVDAPAVTEPVTVYVTAEAPGSSGVGSLTVVPSGQPGPSSLTLSASSVIGGNPITALLTLGAPAPEGGLFVELSTNRGEATPPAGVTVPEGQLGVEFLVTTVAVPAPVLVRLDAMSDESTAAAHFTILPADGDPGPPSEATLLSLTVTPAEVTGGDPAFGTVTLAEPAPASGAIVRLSSESAHASVPAEIVIPGGDSSATFTVDTSPVEEDQSATIQASSANTAEAALAILTEAGSEPPAEATILSLTLNPSTVTGGEPSTGTVTIDAAAPAGGVTVSLSSGDPAATVPASVTIPEGASSADFGVATSSVEATTSAQIAATSANTANATLTIEPASSAQATILSLALDPSTVTGGDSSTGTVTIDAAAPAGGVTVGLSSGDPAATVPASVTVPEGASSADFTVATTSVETSTAAQITATSANAANATLTIEPKPCVASIEVSAASILGGEGLTGLITLTAAAGPGGVDVQLDSSVAALSVPATVHIDEGEISASFSISTTPVASLLSAVITATLDGCSGVQVTVSVNSPCVSELELSVSTVVGGDSVTGVVTLTGPAPAGGSEITLLSSNAAVSLPSSVTVPEGETSVSFDVGTAPVATILGAVIEALLGDCPGVTANLTVEAPILQALSISPSTFPLLGGTTATVTLSGPAPAAGVTVDLAGSEHGIIAGLASGTLRILTPSTVTVSPGETEAVFSVNATLTGLLGLLTNQTGQVTATLDGVVKTEAVTVTP